MFGFIFLLKLRRRSIFHVFGTRQKQGGDEAVAEGETYIWVGVLSQTWERWQLGIGALCDITKGQFPELCVLAQTKTKTK